MEIVKRIVRGILPYVPVLKIIPPARRLKLRAPEAEPVSLPAARRPRITPQRVTSWRKARMGAERAQWLRERAHSLYRRWARPSIRRRDFFVRAYLHETAARRFRPAAVTPLGVRFEDAA